GRAVRREGEFRPQADCAAPTVVAVGGREHGAVRGSDDVVAVGNNGRTALEIEQGRVERITDLAGKDAERIHPRTVDVRRIADAYAAPLEVSPIALQVETVNPGPGLEAITHLAAGHAAG